MNTKITKRSKNFSDREKAVLVRLIEQNAHILENKKTDALTNKIKKETWENITAQFNAFNAFNADFSGPRDSKQLRILYDNMKRTVRKELAEENKIQSLIRMNPIMPDDITKHKVDIKPELTRTTDSRLSETDTSTSTIPEKVTSDRTKNAEIEIPPKPTPEVAIPEPFITQVPRKRVLSKKTRVFRSCEFIKKQYLLKKLQIADFEFRSKMEQHALEVEMKKLQIELLRKQLNSSN